MKPRFAWLLVVAIGAAATFAVFQRVTRRDSVPEGLIQASGRLEADHVTVTGKFAGRVAELTKQEGDSVAAGEVLARLDDTQIKARVEQARQAVSSLEAQIDAAGAELDLMSARLPLDIRAAEAELRHATAQLESDQSTLEQRKRDMDRYREAATRDASNQREREQAELDYQVASQRAAITEASLRQAESALAIARLGQTAIQAKKAAIKALGAQRDQARAALDEARSVLADMQILSPSAGTITSRPASLGEVASPGAPLFDLVDLDELYLKVYVPEAQVGKLRIGLPSRIYMDAFPGESFPATVRYIASRAEFTPKEVQTPDERVKLVFAVKLYLDANAEHRLAPGMPADAIIRWKEEVPWTTPRW